MYRPFVFTIPADVQPGDQVLVTVFADTLDEPPTLAFRPNSYATWSPPIQPENAS